MEYVKFHFNQPFFCTVSDGTCEILFQISTNEFGLHHVGTTINLSNKKERFFIKIFVKIILTKMIAI